MGAKRSNRDTSAVLTGIVNGKSGLQSAAITCSHEQVQMSKPLTDRQTIVLDFLREFMTEHGHAPTEREIQSGLGFSSQTLVRHYLDALDRAGVIIRNAGKARGLTLPGIRSAGTMLRIPVYGTIAAGFPGETEQSSEGCITVDADTLHLPRNARTFALRVRGDSMIGINIVDGDNVILEFREPKHGDVVAALIDGETTLKRYVIRKNRPFLRAENPNYPDLIPAQELVVQGVMVALLRVPQPKKRPT